MRAHLWIPLVLLGCCGTSFAQVNVLKDALPLTKDALLLLPAEQASGNYVEESNWSSDGMYLLIRRRVMDYSTREYQHILEGTANDAPVVRHEIAVYSAISGKTKVLTQISDPAVVEDMTWIPGTTSVLIQTRIVDANAAHRTLSLLSASGGLAGTLISEMADDASYAGSPELPYMFLTQASTQTPGSTEVRFIGARGLFEHMAVVPATNGTILTRDQGKSIYYIAISHGKRVPGGWHIDPMTGQVNHVDAVPAFTQTPQTPDEVELQPDRTAIGDSKPKTYAQILKLVSTKDQASLVVTTDGESGELAPGATAISYRSRGSLMVRRIARVNLDYYKTQLKVAMRQRAIDAAKQVALAILMCANDYDDVYPSNGKGWQDKIGPYLKSDDLAAMFNYTFAGGAASGIASPAEQILGYVDGPDGGRAVAFSDGHVKWINP